MDCFEPALRVLSDAPGCRVKLLEIVVVLGATAALFWRLREDMQIFGYFVYVGLLYVVRSAPDARTSLLAGALTGAIGAATEYWGCVSTGLWNWVDPSFGHAGDANPTRSLWMAGDGGGPRGFPIEVVVAYAGAGFWMASISMVVLAPEHAEVRREAAARGRVPAAAAAAAAASSSSSSSSSALHKLAKAALLWLAAAEPAFRQSALLLALGVHATRQLPPRALRAAWAWGAVVGTAGLFFEIFATGGALPSFAVWRYSPARVAAAVARGVLRVPVPFVRTAPLSALPAYVGTGLVVFGEAFQVTARRARAVRRQKL